MIWLYCKVNPRKYNYNKAHAEKVEQIQLMLKQYILSDNKKPICSNRTQNDAMTTRNTYLAYKHYAHGINLESLNQIINLDTDKLTVQVETRVTIGELIDFLIDKQLMFPVVPELRILTIGGLVTGAGIESSSHVYGLFMNCCVAYEVLLSDGSVQIITESNNPELYSAIPFSSGSLCILLSVTLKIQKCKPYVRINYERVDSYNDAIELLAKYSGCDLSAEGDNNKEMEKKTKTNIAEFVEGLIFTEQLGLIITAKQVDADKVDYSNLNRIHWYSEFWHRYVKRKYGNKGGMEYMLLKDYLFRHDRGVFWTIERKFPISLNFYFRLFFGWLLDGRIRKLSILSDRGKAEELNRESKRVVQDPIVPFKHALKALQYFDELFGITPIWLCPFKFIPLPSQSLLNFTDKYLFYLDIGLYSSPTVRNYNALESHRKMEKFLRDHNSFLAPYAVNYSTKSEFYTMYNKTVYEKMREELKGEGVFVDLYEKIGGGYKVSEFN